MREKRFWLVAGFFLFVAVSGLVCSLTGRDSRKEAQEEAFLLTENLTSGEEPEVQKSQEEESRGKEEQKAVAFICGAVLRPGVYELEEGARLFDLLEQAGGFAEEAAEDALNLAACVTDGSRYYIPTREEAAAGLFPEEGQPASDGRVAVNTATKEQLMTLPGIGESKADKIIADREKNGPFRSVDDLTRIDGIKEGILNSIRDKITTD
ncbi:ComEA family DNA-binding protein [Anaerolentibacter hominis]|uniref:ComEA family DNA-binding protein n=1 Tax=Anaerolentibacter hominis TaxID=3079009 RepID=UPI0031B88AD0